jgi:hypothetical protein
VVSRPSHTARLALVFGLVLLAGMALRLAYPADIEYKADERWTFDTVRAVLDTGEPMPPLGMPMSVGGRNPGLSVWVFVGLGWISGASTPPELARAVQVTNCAALLALVLFALTSVPRSAREPWFWAIALWAANPAAVIFERKIWPPSVLPLLTVALIAAWWHRRRWGASFLAALLAALMAQLHPLAGLFFVALLVWGLLDEPGSVRWSAILLGGLLGSVPAIPWLLSLAAGSDVATDWRRVPLVGFYRRWALQPFGFSAHYTLGSSHLAAALRWPPLGAWPTYLMAAAHAMLAAAALLLWMRAIATLAAQRHASVRALFIGSDRTTALVCAAVWGYGGLLTLMTLTGAGSERHYLIVVGPIMALWVARLAAVPGGGRLDGWARILLAASCAGQLLVSGLLLHYIHHARVIEAEYGATWSAQQDGLAPAPRVIHTSPE